MRPILLLVCLGGLWLAGCRTIAPPVPLPSTPALTPLPSSTPTLPPQIVTAGHLPPVTHDMLVVNGVQEYAIYDLSLWDHTTGRIEILAGPHAPDPSQRVQSAGPFWIVRYHNRPAIVTIAGIDKLLVTDLATRAATTLQIAGEHLTPEITPSIAVSPDGRRIAYVSPPPGYGEQSAVYFLALDAPDQPGVAGECHSPTATFEYQVCGEVRWAPDSQSLAWNDTEGIWQARVGQPGARLLLAQGAPAEEQPGTHSRALRYWYWPVAWSPSGRYLLLRVSGHSLQEGWDQAVLDTQTGRVAYIPGAWELLEPSVRVAWLRDDRLFTMTHESKYDNPSPNAPSIALWHVDPAGPTLLVRDAQSVLPVSSDNYPLEPMQLDDGRLAFALINSSSTDDASRGLYSADPQDLAIRKLSGLPPGGSGARLSWAPDGSGAIFSDGGASFYVSIDEHAIYSLAGAFSNGDALSLSWVP
jgi:hypothetical protein